MAVKRWSEQEIAFIEASYPTRGPKWCAQQLGLSRSVVQKFGLSRGLKTDRRELTKHYPPKPTKPSSLELFEKIAVNQSPESAYTLGFLWADGWLFHTNRAYNIGVEILADDLRNLSETFSGLLTGKPQFRQREGRREQGALRFSNRPLFEFLVDHDYMDKTWTSAEKILAHIPENLHKFWFRGLMDGDGCFYAHEKRRLTQASIASGFEQNWRFIETIWRKLGIDTYTISRSESRMGNKSSEIRMAKGANIIKWGAFLYGGFGFDGIGLRRKFEKFQQIVDLIARERPQIFLN